MAEIKIPRWKYTPPEGEGLNIDKALMNYESPIEVISKRMRTSVEDGIFNAILEQGISVDKEELIKALRYDREQYEKGFNDGCIGATKEIKREVAREIIGEVFSYVHGNEKLTEKIPEIELFKFGMFIGELEKKYDPKSKKIITDNVPEE